MPIDHATALAFRRTTELRYGPRDCCFYALSIGFAANPLDERELDFVLETRGPKVVPTMAVVHVQTVSRDLGLDVARVLHGEQRLAIHRPMPPAATLRIDTHIVDIVDKGPGKGAIITFEAIAREAGVEEPLFTLTGVLFARGDGGIGGATTTGYRPHRLPDRAPDATHAVATRPEQALLYRLNRDLNPLHADPETARRAGFPRPILHGLASYGNAMRTILAHELGYDAGTVERFDVRFTAPVFPGEAIAVDVWREPRRLSFRCRVPARDVTFIDNGLCTLR